SWAAFAGQLARALQTDHSWLGGSLLVAGVAGVVTASLALATCRAVRGAPRLGVAILVVAALAWAMPGPLVGLGMKEVIHALLDVTGSDIMEEALYRAPSPVPLVWADVVRFFPCALALLWPVVRRIPPELSDAARVDGAGALAEFRHVVWPA